MTSCKLNINSTQNRINTGVTLASGKRTQSQSISTFMMKTSETINLIVTDTKTLVLCLLVK